MGRVDLVRAAVAAVATAQTADRVAVAVPKGMNMLEDGAAALPVEMRPLPNLKRRESKCVLYIRAKKS